MEKKKINFFKRFWYVFKNASVIGHIMGIVTILFIFPMIHFILAYFVLPFLNEATSLLSSMIITVIVSFYIYYHIIKSLVKTSYSKNLSEALEKQPLSKKTKQEMMMKGIAMFIILILITICIVSFNQDPY